MALPIPPIGAQFETLLKDASDNRVNEKFAESLWTDDLLPRIKSRLHDLVEISTTQGEEYSVRPEGVNLPEAIKGVYKRIYDHIDENFSDSPPFTLPRIAEVLLNPDKEGYQLTNNVSILKYFNSLAKLVLVSSGLDNFPQTTFSEVTQKVEQVEVIEPIRTTQTVVNIPLVEIPWLKQDDSESAQKSDSPVLEAVPHIPPPLTLVSDENISKNTLEVPKSPRRRRDQDIEDSNLEEGANGPKKAKTEGLISPTTPSRIMSDEESDKMDLSSNTLDEVVMSPNPPEVPGENASPVGSFTKNDDDMDINDESNP